MTFVSLWLSQFNPFFISRGFNLKTTMGLHVFTCTVTGLSMTVLGPKLFYKTSKLRIYLYLTKSTICLKEVMDQRQVEVDSGVSILLKTTVIFLKKKRQPVRLIKSVHNLSATFIYKIVVGIKIRSTRMNDVSWRVCGESHTLTLVLKRFLPYVCRLFVYSSASCSNQ